MKIKAARSSLLPLSLSTIPDNIYLAYTKVRKGKTKSYGVVQFEKELERNLEDIHEKLKDGSYRTSEYQTFRVMVKSVSSSQIQHR